jgi:basic membrane protein A
MSKSKKLGFVAAKPIPQVLRNINAFTLGARSVKPGITTSVIFTGDWSMPVKEAEATNSLADQGVDVFTMHVDGPKVVVETAAKRGKMVCGYHASQAKLAPQAYLTGAEWNWLTRLQDRSSTLPRRQAAPQLRARRPEGRLREDVRLRPGRDRRGQERPTTVKAQDDRRHVRHLQGPLKDNKGKVVIPKGKTLKQTDLELEKMNYLVEGVVGSSFPRRRQRVRTQSGCPGSPPSRG